MLRWAWEHFDKCHNHATSLLLSIVEEVERPTSDNYWFWLPLFHRQPPPHHSIPYLLLLLAIKAQLFLIGNLSKPMLTVHRPPYLCLWTHNLGRCPFQGFLPELWALEGGVEECLYRARGSEHFGEGQAPTPPSPPDLSVTVWVRKKRWKDRLDRCGAGFPVPLGKSEAQGGSLAC